MQGANRNEVGVTGYGVVGKATADVLQRLGHTVVVQDTSVERLAIAREAGCLPASEMSDAEVNFVCVPEGHLESAVAALPIGPISVLRSTTPPGTTDGLAERFGRPLLYMPEFLREATSSWDAMNPNFMLIGTHDREAGDVVARLFEPLVVPIIQVEPAVAEMVKISLNCYLHTIISYWNEIHLICERIGLPSHVIGKICSQDPRVSSYGAAMHGTPVGGRCLPKDITQLIGFAQELGYSPDLLYQVQGVNEKLLEAIIPVTSNGHHNGNGNGNGNGHNNGHNGDHLEELVPGRGALRQSW